MLLSRCLGRHSAQTQDLLAGDVDALVVCSCQQLSGQIVCAANEVLALHLADHAVGPRLADFHERLLDLRLPLRSPVSVANPTAGLCLHSKQPLSSLDLDPLLCQLAYFGNKHGIVEDPRLHVF